MVSLDEMKAVGPELTGTIGPGAETGFEAELAPGVHCLVPFSVGGAGIVVGKPATVAVTDPVRHLTVTPFADYATVSWEWPANAQLAEVSWRARRRGRRPAASISGPVPLRGRLRGSRSAAGRVRSRSAP